MTRLWQPAVPIIVWEHADCPTRMVWQHQTFSVQYIAVRWRIRIWWRDIWREYFKVVIQRGTTRILAVIYRDLQTGEWYLQEIYD